MTFWALLSMGINGGVWLRVGIKKVENTELLMRDMGDNNRLPSSFGNSLGTIFGILHSLREQTKIHHSLRGQTKMFPWMLCGIVETLMEGEA